MTTRIFLISIVLMAPVCSLLAQTSTNAVKTNVLERLFKMRQDQIDSGQHGPWELTQEEDAELVRQGILPPMNAASETNRMPATNISFAATYSFRFKNAPANWVLDEYQRISGKRLEGPTSTLWRISVTVMTEPATKDEALRLIEKGLSESGITIEHVGTNKIKAVWSPTTFKAQPRPDP